MIDEVFHPEASHKYSGRYFNNYRVSISSDPHIEGVHVNVLDADASLAVVEFSPERAREVAKVLNAAAEDVESRRPRKVGDTELTEAQLMDLPKGSVVQFAGTRHAIRVYGAYHSWLTDAGAEWSSRTLADDENKLLFISEETA